MMDSPTIVLTRPEGENESLAEMLTASYSDVRIHPLIELSALEITPAMRATAQNLDEIDLLIFVSKSAVRFTLPLLDSFWPQWPISPRWFAVGEGTAGMLADWDVQAEFPEQPGSEGLLALPALASVEGNKITIARGQGGRGLLADELARRGADVSYLETYRREAIEDAALGKLPQEILVVVTSVEILEALEQNIGERLKTCRLVVVSDRIEQAARDKGASLIRNAGGASDQALYDAIVNWD